MNFFGAVQGGVWERAAAYTPAAMVAEFQHGLVRLDTVLIALIFMFTGLGLAALWMRLGVAVRRRVYESIGLGALAAAAIFACTLWPASWDTSESRANSFPESDERALRQIPRAAEHYGISGAGRSAPRSIWSITLFPSCAASCPNSRCGMYPRPQSACSSRPTPHYGEIWYYLGGRKTMSRMTTAEGVLEAIYSLAGIAPPPETDAEMFRGHPLAVAPTGAGAIFYGLWPCVFIAGGILTRRIFR